MVPDGVARSGDLGPGRLGVGILQVQVQEGLPCRFTYRHDAVVDRVEGDSFQLGVLVVDAHVCVSTFDSGDGRAGIQQAQTARVAHRAPSSARGIACRMRRQCVLRYDVDRSPTNAESQSCRTASSDVEVNELVDVGLGPVLAAHHRSEGVEV